MEKYSKLGEYQKEKMVLDRLKEDRIWRNGTVNEGERLFSKQYVENKYEEYMRNRGK